MMAENGVMMAEKRSHDSRKLELRVENDHLTAGKDGLTIENWYQDDRTHNQKIRILNLKSFVTWTLVACHRQSVIFCVLCGTLICHRSGFPFVQ